MKRYLTAALALALMFVTTTSGWTCAVPVFRYALEKWQPGVFEVVVFHEGDLTAPQKVLLKQMQSVSMDAKNAPRANFFVHAVDIDGKMDAKTKALYASLNNGKDDLKFPLMVIRHPAEAGLPAPFWTGPLTKANADSLVQSPARKLLAERIMKGQTAVWLLIESGDRKADDAAETLLNTELSKFANKKNLPDDLPLIFSRSIAGMGSLYSNPLLFTVANMADENQQKNVTVLVDKLNGPVMPLRLNFSVIRVKRNDPAEAIFVQMMLHSEPAVPGEPALWQLTETIVFPIFGRGRAKYALVGKGINADNVVGDATFLTGPCTCTIKKDNPGFDVLVQANWDAAVGDSLIKESDLPPLVGIGGGPKIQDLDPPEPKTPKDDLTGKQFAKLNNIRPSIHRQWSDYLTELEIHAKSDPEGKVANVGKNPLPGSNKADARPDQITIPQMPRASDTENDGSQRTPPANGNRDKTPTSLFGNALLRNSVIALLGGILVIGVVYILARRNTRGI